MPTWNEPYTTYDRGWMVRIQPPRQTGPAPRRLLLLHGWTGDETVMWIFARNLPENTWIFAPRGPVQSQAGGYGWVPHNGKLPHLRDFEQIVPALIQEFQRWTTDVHAPQEQFDVMGFSQGAAMAYALAALYPHLVNRVIALAGFLPHDDPMPGRYQVLSGKNIYIAHGSKDTTVPLELAQEAVQVLQSVGAVVTYCESDVGHKMGAGCLRGLEAFMKK